VSVYFEAVVVAADQPALIRLLEESSQIIDPDDPEPLAAINWELYRIANGRFVLFGWRAGARRPDAAEEVDGLAEDLSRAFTSAVAVHYNDQVGVKTALLA
jgi:hypothetical protein